MAWAVSAVAAVFTATEVTAALVFTAIAAVGTAASVIGLVTGNQGLIKFGAIAGLVGGIGSIAAANGLIGETAALAEGGNAVVDSAGGFAAEAAQKTAELGLAQTANGVTAAAPDVFNVAGVGVPAAGGANLGTLAVDTAGIAPAAQALGSDFATTAAAQGSSIMSGKGLIDTGMLDIADAAKPLAVGANSTIDSLTTAGTKAADSGGIGKLLSDGVSGVENFWSKLDPSSKLSAGQTVAGLFKGANEKENQLAQQRLAQEQQNFLEQQANLRNSNANAQPVIGMTYNQNATPFSPAPVDPRRFITQPGTGMISAPGTPAGR